MKSKTRVGRYLIYGLLDPRDNSLRYIGKTHKRREWRLAEHIECAKENDKRPVYDWIRELLHIGLTPCVFVWKRIPPEQDWRQAEIDAITFWRNPENIKFPYVHPPQTPKSETVIIEKAQLENIADGG